MSRKSKVLYGVTTLILFFLFLIFFYQYIIKLYVLPNLFNIPILLLIGFAIILISFFYLFLNIAKIRDLDKNLINIKMFNEHSVKSVLLILMFISLFIQPITFSSTIIDWNQINFLNYFRSIVYLFGILIIPGSIIFNILLPNNKLHERLGVKSYLIKITFYPLLSFTFIGTITLILEVIGLITIFFDLVVFLILLILYFIEILVHKYRNSSNKLYFKVKKIQFSKIFLFFIFIIIGIFLISLQIHISSMYLIPGDRWRGISYANFIGTVEFDYIFNCDEYSFYVIYWGYISYGLSKLSGLPFININAFLFIFLYLFVTSSYLLFRSILIRFKKIYSLLATFLFISFSGFYSLYDLQYVQYGTIFNRVGIFQFSYHSFAFFCLFISFTLFILIVQSPNRVYKNKAYFKTEEFVYILISALLLIQCLLLYLTQVIHFFVYIFIFIIFSRKKQENLKKFIYLFAFFLIFFVFYDIFFRFFISWTITRNIFYFFGFHVPILFIYIAIFIVSIFLIILYKFLTTHFKTKYRIEVYNNRNKSIFIFISLIYSFLIIFEIVNFFILNKSVSDYSNSYLGYYFSNKGEDTFGMFYLNLIFINLGFIGILGVCSFYFIFRKSINLFKILIFWIFLSLILASFLIFAKWIKDPFISPLNIRSWDYYIMMYWFSRNWYYLIIPFSIFSSIGIIKFVKYLKKKSKFKFQKAYIELFKLIIFLNITFYSISNIVLAGIYWSQDLNYVKGDEAQIMGWVSENIPIGSKVLTDTYRFDKLDNELIYCTKYTYKVYDEILNALINRTLNYYGGSYSGWEINHFYDLNCTVQFLKELDGYLNITSINDQSNNGSSIILVKFDYQKSQGTINFNLRFSNTSKYFTLELLAPSELYGILLYTDSGALYCYNGSTNQYISNIIENSWYSISIYFECSNTNYNGLNKFNWKIKLNGTEYGNYLFFNNVSEILYLKFYTDLFDSNYNIYLSNLNFSWSSNFNIERMINNIPLVIDYLKSNHFEHFINSIENKEKYLELFNTLYKEKVFEYGRFIIYKSIC